MDNHQPTVPFVRLAGIGRQGAPASGHPDQGAKEGTAPKLETTRPPKEEAAERDVKTSKFRT
jgi:hypothetical protein